jgi:hypothetical protein
MFAWPVAAVVIVVLLRRAIVEALKGFSSRATKLSVGIVAVELAAASARSSGGTVLDDVRDTATTAAVGDSSRALMASLDDASRADYTVVDLGSGQEWLTSRLYIVATLVARMRRLRTVVFVATENGKSRLVGVVEVQQLRWALASHFPWLELAFVQACWNAYLGLLPVSVERQQLTFMQEGPLDPGRAPKIFQQFKSLLQQRTTVAPTSSGWEHLSSDLWERAEWVTPDRLFQLLGSALVQTAVVRDLDTTEEQFAQRVMRATEDFLPVVDARHVFQRLVNRASFVNRSVRRLADQQ